MKNFPIFPLQYSQFAGNQLEGMNNTSNYGTYIHHNLMKNYGISNDFNVMNISELASRFNNLRPGAPLYVDGGFDLATAGFRHVHELDFYGSFFEPDNSFHANENAFINYIDTEYIDLRNKYAQTINLTERKIISQQMQDHMLEDMIYIPLYEMMTNLYFQPIFNIDKYQAQILYSSYTEGTGYSQFWHKLNGSFALRIQDDVDNPDFDRYSNPVSKLNPWNGSCIHWII